MPNTVEKLIKTYKECEAKGDRAKGGRGGSDITEILELAKALNLKKLIMVTDGWFLFPSQSNWTYPYENIQWVLTTSESNVPEYLTDIIKL